ncbi:MAG: amidohydrolase family protein [Calditrichae bacterium]|nr:amidohydrolase family protein [Calditrichia bacterium]
MKITNAWICQIKEKKIIPVFGDLSITDGKITGINPTDFESFIHNPAPKKDSTFDAGGRVLTTPLVNFHEHFYSRLAKGFNISGPMDSFLNILKSLWWKLDLTLTQEMICASVLMGAMESIRNGVTYVFDHHASPAFTKGSLSLIADTLQEFGLRGVLCFEISDRNGPQMAGAGVEENRDFLKHCNDDIKALLGLHASFTLSDESLQKAATLRDEFDLGIHVHICEGFEDRQISESDFNEAPLKRLLKHGLVNPKSILSHGIHLQKEELEQMAEIGCAMALNPDSNMNNAVGLPDFTKLPLNLPLLCGTDGMHANPAKTLKQLFLLFRHQGGSFDDAFNWIQKVYFDQLSFVSQYFHDFPALNIGDRADMILWDYVPPTPFSIENFWGHYIYGIVERQVHSVVQNGKWLMRDFQLQNIDESIFIKDIFTEGKKLFDKMSKL